MYVRHFCTITYPPMVVLRSMYKFWNFCCGFKTRDGCALVWYKLEGENRASKFVKLSIAIASSQGRRRMLHFFQTCWIQSLKSLAWFTY